MTIEYGFGRPYHPAKTNCSAAIKIRGLGGYPGRGFFMSNLIQ